MTRDVREGAIAVVPIQTIRCRRCIVIWRTVVGQCGFLVETGLFHGRSPVDIVDHEQIQVPVQIQIEEQRRRSPTGIGDTGRLGDVFELTGAVVSQQRIGAEIRHVEIDIAVIVVVTGRHPHAIPRVGGTAAAGDFLETSVTDVLKQLVAGRIVGKQLAALNQVNVEIAVIVQIGECRAAAHDFRKEITLRVTGLVLKDQSALGCLFLEPGCRRGQSPVSRICGFDAARQQQKICAGDLPHQSDFPSISANMRRADSTSRVCVSSRCA